MHTIDDHNDGWIHTYTGRKFWPLNPRVEDIHIQDIAGALSKINRFGGHSIRAYSVGQHCILGSYEVERLTKDPVIALAFLLHDASEAYLGDVVRPVKHLPEFAFYREAEAKMNKVIEEKFNVSLDQAIVHEIDNLMLLTEFRDLTLNGHELAGNKKLLDKIEPWAHRETEEYYLTRFSQLCYLRNTV
jgi:5'-deoxynucleotidase YfbR-like HD superfamily hydrolase